MLLFIFECAVYREESSEMINRWECLGCETSLIKKNVCFGTLGAYLAGIVDVVYSRKPCLYSTVLVNRLHGVPDPVTVHLKEGQNQRMKRKWTRVAKTWETGGKSIHADQVSSDSMQHCQMTSSTVILSVDQFSRSIGLNSLTSSRIEAKVDATDDTDYEFRTTHFHHQHAKRLIHAILRS